MQKNVAGQKFVVFAFNRTTNVPLVGDAANITANLQKDFGTSVATNDVNPTQLEDGFYAFNALQAETNADVLNVYPESSTADIQVITVPGIIYTVSAGSPNEVVQTADHTAGIAAIPLTAMRGTDGVDTATMRGTDGVDTATMRGTDGVDTGIIKVGNSPEHITLIKGGTSQSIQFTAYATNADDGAKLTVLAFDTAGLTAFYNRTGDAGPAVEIPLVVMTKGTWVNGGMIPVDATNQAGEFELGLPDLLAATGVDRGVITLEGAANMKPVTINFELASEIDLGSDNRVLVSLNAHTSGQTVADITADLLAKGDVDGFTVEESLKLILAASVGVLAGAATTEITIQAADGSKTRITATVDADGNRSAVIKDVTG